MHETMECTLCHIKLTPRGAEVFRRILQGASDRQIAEHLGISYSGVRRHKEKMLLANGCEFMRELIARYYELHAGECGKKRG